MSGSVTAVPLRDTTRKASTVAGSYEHAVSDTDGQLLIPADFADMVESPVTCTKR